MNGAHVSEIVLVRHGTTEWSRVGRHTGRTDLPLTPQGESDAAALRPLLAGCSFGLVLVSPLQRARRTVELAGFPSYDVDPDLIEWDYGNIEGKTAEELSAARGGPWSIWDGSVADGGGETADEVASRAARVLARATACLDTGKDVLLVGHGHGLRILAATWLGLHPRAGALLVLSAGSVSALGFEHNQPVVQRWNVRPADCAPM